MTWRATRARSRGRSANDRIDVASYVLDRKPARLADLAGDLASGAVHPVIGAEIDLADAAKPTPVAIAGARGKTVIRVRG
ncbi:hypothetical protein [Frankia sp. R43]|uniref:hypothetical protein n=1 Tax=Frankia sp. R43 TaxID=269536 RepID=UPI001054E8DD|nr:hypothetical protein [Frankia sp. R43]